MCVMGKSGFTLVEVMIGLLLVIFLSSLGFVAIQTTTSSANLSRAQSELQSEARNIIIALSREVEAAVQPIMAGEPPLPPGVQGLQVLDAGRTLRFQVPLNETFTAFSAPVTIRYENEDLPDEQAESILGNALLDGGEDTNEDGVLTRRLVRQQAGVTGIVGGANHLADVRFELQENGDVLRVSLVLTRPMGTRPSQLIRCQVQEDIYLMN